MKSRADVIKGWFRKGDSDLVTAEVILGSDGQNKVLFSPEQPSEYSLCLLALCYAAKLRHLADYEPRELAKSFEIMLSDALINWPSSSAGLLDSMPFVDQLVKNAPGGHKWAVDAGEVFKVTLIEYRQPGVRARFSNSLPRPGLSFNLAWNYIVLLDSIVAGLNDFHKAVLSDALLILMMDMFDAGANFKAVRSYLRLHDKAIEALELSMNNAVSKQHSLEV